MLHQSNYKLETTENGRKKKYECPQCHYKNKFTRYINIYTREYLSEVVGRCDRENDCKYHYSPSCFFSDTGYIVTKSTPYTAVTSEHNVTTVTTVTPVQYLPFELMDRSVTKYSECNLYPFLAKTFGEAPAAQLCRDYFIGANKYGDTVFWQVDSEGNVRQAKVMQYNPETGRRNKDKGAYFAGKKILNDPMAHLEQCFFGEYLLNEFPLNTPIAIVESEKTAVIASMYYPDFVWLATGGKTGCKWTEEKICKVLKGRKVILFPDLNAYNTWNTKGKLMEAVAGCKVAVSSLLEDGSTAEEKKAGLDLADYLLAERGRRCKTNM